MKIQYLGDSRDSFKWDYQDHLTSYLGYTELRVVPMLTPNDSSNHGQTPPDRFPARPEVVALCEQLRATKKLTDIRKLPEMTGANYHVEVYRPNEVFADDSRAAYFASAGRQVDKVVFLDPDNGFEPKNRTEKHVGYSDVEAILDQITDDSVVSVFQYYRRRKFDQDFQDIRRRTISGYSAAIFDRHVMFVSISRSRKTIESVVQANQEYAYEKRLGMVPDLLQTQGGLNSSEKFVKQKHAKRKLERKVDTYSIEQILDALNTHKIRATYSAVASLIGAHPRMLAGQYLGNRRPYASWVVSKATGMPTKYSSENCHTELQSKSHVIEDTAELVDLIRSG